MKNCIDCGGELEHVKIRKPNRIQHYLKCVYCSFHISANEGDVKELNEETTAPPIIQDNKIYY